MRNWISKNFKRYKFFRNLKYHLNWETCGCIWWQRSAELIWTGNGAGKKFSWLICFYKVGFESFLSVTDHNTVSNSVLYSKRGWINITKRSEVLDSAQGANRICILEFIIFSLWVMDINPGSSCSAKLVVHVISLVQEQLQHQSMICPSDCHFSHLCSSK